MPDPERERLVKAVEEAVAGLPCLIVLRDDSMRRLDCAAETQRRRALAKETLQRPVRWCRTCGLKRHIAALAAYDAAHKENVDAR